MKSIPDRAGGIAVTSLLLFALLMGTGRTAPAEEDPVALPAAAAEALEQNGSLLEGSLIEALAEGELEGSSNSSKSKETKQLIRLSERLLQTARQLEAAGEAVSGSSTLVQQLRVAALECLAHALDRPLGRLDQGTRIPPPTSQIPGLSRPENELDPPSFTLPPRDDLSADPVPVDPPSLDN